MMFFRKQKRKKAVPLLSPDEQLRLKVLLEKCDVSLIKEEFNQQNIEVLIDELTPLQLAIQLNCEELIRFFISLHADIDKPFPDGNTPLIRLCGERKTELAIFFIEQGADILKANISKTTPLWYAAMDLNITLIKALMDKGANPFIDTGNGISVYKTIKSMGIEDMIEVMEQYKSKFGVTS